MIEQAEKVQFKRWISGAVILSGLLGLLLWLSPDYVSPNDPFQVQRFSLQRTVAVILFCLSQTGLLQFMDFSTAGLWWEDIREGRHDVTAVTCTLIVCATWILVSIMSG